MKRICVFCGSATGRDPVYAEAARSFGATLAERGIGVVFGGGRVGLMGVLADAALAAGGEVIGVIPHGLMQREVGHVGVTHMHVVRSMHERKAKMHELSDAFVTLPGGVGSLEELLETLTWVQLGIHRKPCAVWNVNGYYDPLIAQFALAEREGFVRPANRALLIVERDIERLLERCADWTSPVEHAWLEPDEA